MSESEAVECLLDERVTLKLVVFSNGQVSWVAAVDNWWFRQQAASPVEALENLAHDLKMRVSMHRASTDKIKFEEPFPERLRHGQGDSPE